MEIIIVVKDGLVQSVYSDGAAIVSVCDLDTTYPDEYDETAADLEEIESNPDFHTIY